MARIDFLKATALAYRAHVDKMMAAGSNAEKKKLIRSCVDYIALTPDTLEVEINYKIPGAIGALSGSGDALRCYLHGSCCLDG
jgi:hypothetical protein